MILNMVKYDQRNDFERVKISVIFTETFATWGKSNLCTIVIIWLFLSLNLCGWSSLFPRFYTELSSSVRICKLPGAAYMD